VLVVLVVLWAVYLGMLWPWMVRWGATDAELTMSLPGDEIAPVATSTRAITIDAPTSEVWQWLVQVGQDRAAFYSYDWLENLAGVDYHNADRIHPEWQQLAPGELVKGSPDGYLGMPAVGWRPPIVQPERALYLWGPILLEPIDDHTTRLIVRSRGALVSPIVRAATTALYDPAHFVMERGMLLGIKARAERRPDGSLALTLIAAAGWAAVALGTLSALLAQRWGRLAGLVPAAWFATILLSTGDLLAATAAFIALGLPIAGFVTYGWRWWPTFTVIAAYVLLVLLLAENAYLVFGLSYLAAVLLLVAAAIRSRPRLSLIQI
ncbi:MAG TPA: hypothetical protein VFO07_02875, partial [Roseiflexaceae bacterium]|nr:hypothetical protein [Roseiflexaceae bacterium]